MSDEWEDIVLDEGYIEVPPRDEDLLSIDDVNDEDDASGGASVASAGWDGDD